MKKCLTTLLVLMLLMSMVLPVSAETVDMEDDPIVATGSGGTNITWVLTQSGTMTFSGRGYLQYDASNTWQSYKRQTKHLILEEGISGLCTGAFGNFAYMETVEIPKSMCDLGIESLRACEGLEKIVFPGTIMSISHDALGFNRNLKEIYFYGDAPSYISENAFGAMIKTTATVYYPANNPTWENVINKHYGGSLTWVAMEDSEMEEEISVTISCNVGDVTAPADGWHEGTNTFTVTSSDACAVLISHDGGNTYVQLKAKATDAANTYCFTAENVTTQTKIDVVMVGDSNGDGKVSAADITRLSAAYAGKTSLGVIQSFAGDANGDGKVSAADITKLSAAYAGKTTLSW